MLYICIQCNNTTFINLRYGVQVILLYLFQQGLSKNLSEDHKPTDPIETSRIEKAGGFIDEDLRVNGGLNLSRAIGK